MWLYLIHFRESLSHAQHYVGACGDLRERLMRHHSGQGARLLEVLNEQEREWSLVRCWKTEKAFELESHLKRKVKQASRYCPICSPAQQSVLLKLDEFPINLLTFQPTPPFEEKQ